MIQEGCGSPRRQPPGSAPRPGPGAAPGPDDVLLPVQPFPGEGFYDLVEVDPDVPGRMLNELDLERFVRAEDLMQMVYPAIPWLSGQAPSDGGSPGPGSPGVPGAVVVGTGVPPTRPGQP